jgi:UDP-N-acetylmuramate dehydrogenase
MFRERVRLAPYTTLGIGGPARYFLEAFHEKAVIEAAEYASHHALPLFVLGGGSNVVIDDDGFPGLVLRVAIKGISTHHEDGTVLVTAGAGENWDQFVAWCVERNLAGIECLSGIPGLVGGTPVQNVGAYGQEVSETITAVRVYDRQSGEIFTLINSACGFGYRSSIFNSTARDRYIVLEVTFALTPEGQPALRYPDVQKFFAKNAAPSLAEVREAILQIRAEKSMVIVPGDPNSKSAGSFFKNPLVSESRFERLEEAVRRNGIIKGKETIPHFAMPDEKVKIPAAWLIEKAGFRKGHQKGRAGISSRHTLALINRGNATAGEMLQLMREIQEAVNERFGIVLIPEPVFVTARGW